MADEQQQNTETTQQTNAADDGSRDWKAEFQKLSGEIRKVSRERDDYRKRVKDLDGFDPEEYRTLKQQAEQAEEERKRKAGEFDAWRSDIVKKHEAEKATEREQREAAEKKYRQKLISLEFQSASTLFGATGRTVLTPAIAEAYFGRYVDVVSDESGAERVVVKDRDGHVVLSPKTGKPADFSEALAEIIDTLPDKNDILRGSGKAGSGSSGGATHGSETTDFSRLKPSDFRDPKVRQAVKDRQSAAGGLQIGPAWDRAPRS